MAHSKFHDKMFALSDEPPVQPQTTLPGDLGSRRLTREESRLARVEAEEKVLTMSMMYLQGVPTNLLTKSKKLCWEAGLFGKIGPKWSTLAQNGSNCPKQPKLFWMAQSGPKVSSPYIFLKSLLATFFWHPVHFDMLACSSRQYVYRLKFSGP